MDSPPAADSAGVTYILRRILQPFYHRELPLSPEDRESQLKTLGRVIHEITLIADELEKRKENEVEVQQLRVRIKHLWASQIYLGDKT